MTRMGVADMVESAEGKVNFSQYLRVLTCGMMGQDTSQDPPIDFPVLHEQTWQKIGGWNRRLGVLTRVVGPDNLVNLVNI